MGWSKPRNLRNNKKNKVRNFHKNRKTYEKGIGNLLQKISHKTSHVCGFANNRKGRCSR